MIKNKNRNMKGLNFIYVTVCALLILCGCSKDEEIERDMNPPGDFRLIDPGDGFSNVDVYPTFSWSRAMDPEGQKVTYTLIVDVNRNPTIEVASSIDDTFFTLTSRLSTWSTYYWKVIAQDPFGNKSETRVFKFRTRGLNIPDSPTDVLRKFDERISSKVVEFKDKLWIVGGFNDDYKNDVMSSVDGRNWEKVVESASFAPRGDHELVVFKNKLWLIGGNGTDIYGDIWNSSDGVSWSLITDNAPFGPRYGHTVTEFRDDLWLIGGATNGGEGKNDVWKSDDGVNWTLVTPSAQFDPIMYHTTLSYKDKLFVICGYSFKYNTEMADVWASESGAFWQPEGGLLRSRASHTSFVFDNKMWVIGGYNGDYLNDVKYSYDGSTWSFANVEPIKFLPRASHYSIVFNEKIWLHGGYLETQNGTIRILDDVWELD